MLDPNKILVYFGYAMGLIFFGLGLYVLFFLPPEFQIPEKFRVLFGAVLLLYAVYRFITLVIKQRQEENDED